MTGGLKQNKKKITNDNNQGSLGYKTILLFWEDIKNNNILSHKSHIIMSHNNNNNKRGQRKTNYFK